jgi:sirohydrochlorin cobaltochelatase
MTPRIGVMVCGHGSRSQPAVDEFAVVARRLRETLPDWPVEYGYLEFANPVLRDGLDRLRDAGCNHILAVPGMLFAAMHAKNDIPSVLNTYAAKHGVRIDYGRDLGVDPKMLAAAADRVREAIARADAEGGPVPLHETVLVVIGRGASDPDANANVSKVTRLLWEGFGFGWAETGYSGVTFPLVEPCLERVVRLGFRRVVVFPYFLFTGVLVDRIYGFTDWVAERNPEVQFVKAGYLNDHPQVVATFAERVREILDGQNAMNCQMCKYRAQVLGFEAEVGSPQESHHHHVEGQGATAPGSNVADCPLCETFCTGACRLTDAGDGHDHEHHQHGHGHDHHPERGHAHPHHHAQGQDRDRGHRHAPDHEHHRVQGHDHGHTHAHDHTDGHGHHHHHHGHDHDHHHPPYPHADHPLGPESVRRHLKARG